MIDWHFIGIFLAVFLFLFLAIVYEKHLCSKIDRQLTRLEKMVDDQRD